MNRALLLIAVGGIALSVAACDEPQVDQAETAAPPIEAPVAPSATDAGAPVADTTAPTDQPPVDTLPPEERSSEQTVQPESETLFY